MLIKKESCKIKQITPISRVFEYPDPSKDLGIAVSELNGRVPAVGKMVNNVCQEVYYVISGSGEVFYKGETFMLEEGDVFYIEAKTPFHVEADNLNLLLVTSPAFFVEQWENVK